MSATSVWWSPCDDHRAQFAIMQLLCEELRADGHVEQMLQKNRLHALSATYIVADVSHAYVSELLLSIENFVMLCCMQWERCNNVHLMLWLMDGARPGWAHPE